MKYKVCNLERDMKLMRNGLFIIKRGESVSVSQQEYQYLAQVYGIAVKGEIDYAVRVTLPAEICKSKKSESEPVVLPKRKKNKKR